MICNVLASHFFSEIVQNFELKKGKTKQILSHY